MIDILRIVDKITEPLQRRVRIMVARGLIELVDESKKFQSLQVSIRADEVHDDVERFQDFGFSAVPPAGAEAVVVMVGGSADHPVAIKVDDRRYRPTDLEEGESCMWTMQDGKRVHNKANGEVHIGTEPTEGAARADRTLTQLNKITTYLTALDAVFSTMPPEIGLGVPSVFATALMAASASAGGVPSMDDPAADEVKIK